MTLFDYFDRGFVINLPHRKDRRRAVTRELQKAGLPITPGHIDIFPAIRPDDPGGFPTIGARGCFLSHMEVLKQAESEGCERLLVMEDDLRMMPSFRRDADQIVAMLDNADWDLVYLGHREPVSNEGSATTFQLYDKPIQTTHCYGVHRRCLSSLASFFQTLLEREPGDPRGGPMFPDGAISTFREQNPQIKTLIACPKLADQRMSRTDIHELKWFDRVPVVRDAANVGRVIKQRMRTGG